MVPVSSTLAFVFLEVSSASFARKTRLSDQRLLRFFPDPRSTEILGTLRWASNTAPALCYLLARTRVHIR